MQGARNGYALLSLSLSPRDDTTDGPREAYVLLLNKKRRGYEEEEEEEKRKGAKWG